MKFIKALVLASTVALAGCASFGGGTGGGTVDVAAMIAAVQKQTNEICAFVPMAADVAILVSGGNPTVAGASV
jgi:hypothetical protein